MPEIGAKLFDTPLHYLVFFIQILKPDHLAKIRAEASCDVIFYRNFARILSFWIRWMMFCGMFLNSNSLARIYELHNTFLSIELKM